MKARPLNWHLALASWLLATLLVVAGYWLWVRAQGSPVNWRLLARAAAVALLYAAYLGWRFRHRSGGGDHGA